MSLINSFSFAQRAISNLSSTGSGVASLSMQSSSFLGASNPVSNFGSLFSSLDMLTGGSSASASAGPFGSAAAASSPFGSAAAAAGPGGASASASSGFPMQQQCQQQNPMMQMMGMMMQFMMGMMQMIMQMLGMGPQNQQQMGQNNAMAQAGPGGASAAASSPFGSAAAAAGPGGAFAAASSFVAPNQSQATALSGARGAWGDPHYDIAVDKNGNGKIDKGERAKFDHKGKDGHTYNVFQGDGLSVKGKYVPHSNPKAPQVIGETEVTAGNDKFSLTKSGKAKLNGQELKMKDGQTLQLADGTQIKKVNGKEYQVLSKEGDSKINIKAGGNQMEVDPEGNFSGLGGIIGDAMQRIQNGEKMPENKYWEKYDMGVVL